MLKTRCPNRRKIASAVRNAWAFIPIQQEFGSFDAYLWRFAEEPPKQNRWKTLKRGDFEK